MASTRKKGRLGKAWSEAQSVLRTLRKEAVLSMLRIGMHTSQHTSAAGVELLRGAALAAVKACLPLRTRLARNMKLAGVYRKGLVDLHFERAIDQLGLLMHVFRTGFAHSGVAEKFRFDNSFQYLIQAHEAGRGVLVISPHLCCYPLFPRVLSERILCSIYLRRSTDPRKHAINAAIGRAGGGHLVHPPAGATRFERLAVAIRVLREGRTLFITPDLPRKPDQGVPVTILNRTVHFPTGVPIMAMRTGAPIVIVLWCYRDGLYHVRCHEPMDFSARGKRQHRATAAVRKFAGLMDECIRQQPEMWWNWLDKRWTRIIRNKG